jgi:hypothetical protein
VARVGAPAFAVWGLPAQLAEPPARNWPDTTAWAQTPGGLRIPLPMATVRAETSWLNANADMTSCAQCGRGYAVSQPSCMWCGTENENYQPPQGSGSAILAAAASGPAAATPAVTADGTEASHAGPVRVANMYAPGGFLWKCPRGHTYSGPGDEPPCPHCRDGTLGFLAARGRPAGPGGFGGMGGMRFPGMLGGIR